MPCAAQIAALRSSSAMRSGAFFHDNSPMLRERLKYVFLIRRHAWAWQAGQRVRHPHTGCSDRPHPLHLRVVGTDPPHADAGTLRDAIAFVHNLRNYLRVVVPDNAGHGVLYGTHELGSVRPCRWVGGRCLAQ
jgi:hypothetical protein